VFEKEKEQSQKRKKKILQGPIQGPQMEVKVRLQGEISLKVSNFKK